MKAIKFNEIDCSLAEALRGKIDVVEVEDLSGKVPHVGYGGAAKSKYVSPSGKTIYVLERNGMYAADGYANRVWQFEEDFSTAQAEAFIALYEWEEADGSGSVDKAIEFCLKKIEETKAAAGKKEEFFGIVHDGDTTMLEKRLDLLKRMKTIQDQQ